MMQNKVVEVPGWIKSSTSRRTYRDSTQHPTYPTYPVSVKPQLEKIISCKIHYMGEMVGEQKKGPASSGAKGRAYCNVVLGNACRFLEFFSKAADACLQCLGYFHSIFAIPELDQAFDAVLQIRERRSGLLQDNGPLIKVLH